jgi:hypothetical protein
MVANAIMEQLDPSLAIDLILNVEPISKSANTLKLEPTRVNPKTLKLLPKFATARTLIELPNSKYSMTERLPPK